MDLNLNKIAIIGLACRFPGAKTAAQFWHNLRDGVESVRFFSRAELLDAGLEAELIDRPNYVPANASLPDIDLFDADFFGMTPREAEITDPQHRVFLTCAWEALEDAGYDPDDLGEWAGVYAGAGMSSYLLHHLVPNRKKLPVTDFQLLMGNNKDFVPTRVSYRLNLRGPSINVNTACSTSLVAVHMACQGLLDFECDVALAGGVGIQAAQVGGYLYEEGGILSPDGHCRPFDAQAGGTINGSGAGVVVLKRLEDALEHGDHIYAVVLGSAINNDGSDKVGFTAPSVRGQAQVIAEAQAKAAVEPDDIDYIEAHGTATVLGDPIEVRALTQVFRQKSQRVGDCAIGSVKSNLGHLDEAAGVAGLIKTVLALSHRKIPASLNFREPNPHLALEHSPFFVNDQLRDWPVHADRPGRAGVSSFGIGGTNAHIILEEWSAERVDGCEPEVQGHPTSEEAGNFQQVADGLFVVSARSKAGVAEAVKRLERHLTEVPELRWRDVAFTLAQGRRAFCYRQPLLMTADGLQSGEMVKAADAGPKIAFMFPGQGSQCVGMAAGLYATEPVFKRVIDRCHEVLQTFWDADLFDLLVGEDDGRLSETRFAQPALFAVEVALNALWNSWGIHADVLIGHSLGEISAACVAGVLGLEDGLRLVVERGRLMQSCQAGMMLAVRLAESELATYLTSSGLAVAAVNGPQQCVVSGDASEIVSLAERLAADGVACQTVNDKQAFHSHLMEPILAEFTEIAGRIPLHAPQIRMVSNVTGGWLTDSQATSPDYWATHLRQAVRFEAGVSLIDSELGETVFWLEVGPGRTLNKLVGKLSARPRCGTLTADGGHLDRLSLGKMWAHGVGVDWSAVYNRDQFDYRRVPLPAYPFAVDAKRHWVERERPVGSRIAPVIDRTQTAQTDVSGWFYTPHWQQTPSVDLHPHRPQKWLLFENEAQCGISDKLRAAGHQVETVVWDGDAESLEMLLSGLPFRPDQIVDLSGVGPTSGWEGHLFRWLDWVQVIDRLGWTADFGLTLVTTNGYPADRVTALEPEKGVLSGPLRVIPLEYPHIACRQIDFDRLNIELLLAEITTHDRHPFPAEKTVVAYRGPDRYVPVLRQQILEAPAVPPVRTEGVYLITGGLGSMGRAFATYLAAAAEGVQVVLTGRSPMTFIEAGWVAQTEQKLLASNDVRPLESYGQLPTLLNAYCAALVLNYFATCGVVVERGRRYKLDELQSQLRLLPVFARFFDYFLQLLVADHLIKIEQGEVVFLDVGEAPTHVMLHRKLSADYPQFQGLIRYLTHCATHYPAALSGDIPAIQVLYPKGEADELNKTIFDTVEHRFDRTYWRLVAELAIELAAQKQEGRPLRILEVGGGNGNLTLALVDAFVQTGHLVDYYFTDIGRSFVNKARAEAEERHIDFMRFGVLDISREPEKQGFLSSEFDLIIGYNVVHAVPNLDGALAHLHQLLAPGGTLALVETVNHRRWDSLIWGLAEGWWYFDDDYRQAQPLLDLSEWRNVFGKVFGSEQVYTFPQQPLGMGDAGLIVAQKRHFESDRIHYIQADVTDRFAMENVVDDIHKVYGPIQGVIHTAGVLGQGLIRGKRHDDVRHVISPKVAAGDVLADCVQHDPLDFFMLCGSMSSLAPIAGQIDYCGANGYLDSLAYSLRRKGVPATAVDWGFWQALGMIEQSDMSAADKQEIERQIVENGWSKAGIAVFETILAHVSADFPQLVVSPDPVEQLVIHPLFKRRFVDEQGRLVYVAYLNPVEHWVVDEHRLDGVAILPGTAHLELVRAAFTDAKGGMEIVLSDVYFLAPLIFTNDDAQEICLIFDQDGNFFIVDRLQPQIKYTIGKIDQLKNIKTALNQPALPDKVVAQPVAVESQMIPFGPRWHCIDSLMFGVNEGWATLSLGAEYLSDLTHYPLHPALFDMATGFITLQHGVDGGLPFRYGEIVIYRPLGPAVASYAKVQAHSSKSVAFDVLIYDQNGEILVTVTDYQLRKAESISAASFLPSSVSPVADDIGENFQVTIKEPGLLETLQFESVDRRGPAAGQVEIEIVATGLNFIEVLFALGMLPDPGDARFGLECVGRVSRIGAGVTDYVVGDEVMAFAEAACARYTVAPVHQVARKPAHLTFAEAATIPSAFTTAYYALIVHGRLKAGEKVLIHSASGGVGMAAVQIAQWVGAEIYGTAGTEVKRERVRQLGVKYVADSRSLAFGDEILQVTDGYGVDVVLNALGGEFIDKNLEILALNGRFLEIGKRDLFKNHQLDMGHFVKCLSFLVLDVGPDSPGFDEAWRAVEQHFAAGDFRPLPHTLFPLDAMAAGIEFMAQAQHVGKVVLSVVGDALPAVSDRYVPAAGTQQAILQVWQELLGMDTIGLHDDFFDLRGDSLLAAQVISHIHRAVGVRLPLSAVFDHPTVAGLATLVEEIKSESAEVTQEKLGEEKADVEMEEGEI